MAIAVCVLVALLIAVSWFGIGYVVRIFTANQGREVRVEQVNPQQMQVAEAKIDALRSAIRNRQETTIEFTASDLNALVANDPGFRGARGRAHFAIADSIIFLELSAPLDSIPLRSFKSRWFNGRVRFGLSYIDDEFSFDIKSAESNGRVIPSVLFSPEFFRSFNRSFNDSFHRASRHHRDDFWRHLKMISVRDDKLIVTTRGT